MRWLNSLDKLTEELKVVIFRLSARKSWMAACAAMTGWGGRGVIMF
jgi:hypothetical protein